MKRQRGFTLIEIVIVMVVLGVLASLVYGFVVPGWRSRAYYSRSLSELNTMSNAMNLYVAKYNDYPEEVERDIPAGIKEFIQVQNNSDEWPDAPFPGSVYDYENWPPGPNGAEQTYQISIRFCAAGQDESCNARAKRYLDDKVSAGILEAWDADSAVYYCIKGSCRSHEDHPVNHPGYCINCGQKGTIF